MKEQCEMGIKEFVLPFDDPGQYSEIIWKIQSESKIKLRSYVLHFRQLLKTVWTSRSFAFTSIGFRVRIFATKSPFLIFCLIVGLIDILSIRSDRQYGRSDQDRYG